jgi:hypothetical protein
MGYRASILDDESVLYSQYYDALEHMTRAQRLRFIHNLPRPVRRIAWNAYGYLKEIGA